MMRRLAPVLALVLMACSHATAHNPVGTPSQTPAATSSGSANPTPTAGPTASPTASPGSNVPLAQVDFSCRLPAMRSVTFSTYQGGFITFPAASYAADPNGAFINDSQTGILTTSATPVLSGTPSFAASPFYDSGQRRWVPVSPGQSSPDGRFYAYSTFDPAASSKAHVHVVNVAQATETVFDVDVPNNAQGFTVADFTSNGVYLLANTFEQLPYGVWLLDRTNGSMRAVSQTGPVAAVRSGYAWLVAINPTDPNPPQLRRSGTAGDSIVRVDLSNGAQATWFYRPGMEVGLLGFDGRGMPIVNVSDPSGATTTFETWLTGGPSVPGTLVSASSQIDLISPQGDGNRVWFGSSTGIYLYTQAGGLRKVATFSDLQVQEIFVPAGVCS